MVPTSLTSVPGVAAVCRFVVVATLAGAIPREPQHVLIAVVARRVPTPETGTLEVVPGGQKSAVVVRAFVGYLARLVYARRGVTCQGGGRSRYFLLIKTGYEFFRKTRRWHLRERLVDRRGNRYREHIADAETGEVIRDKNQGLDEHVAERDLRQQDRPD